MATSPRVLYFGVYDPNYARNWVLINGLRENGIEVIELRRKPGRLSLVKLFFGYLKLKQKFDVMIVGFPGQEVMFVARFLTFKPIVFDAFTSHYGGYILDRQKFSKNSMRASYYRFLDKWSCKLANIVLLDTGAHINFFVKEFNLPVAKFKKIWIGANDRVFQPESNVKKTDNLFKVIFFGTYIPLQGVEYIVRAAKLLEADKDIVFSFIGKGQDKTKSINLANELELKNIEFIDMMRPEALRAKVCESDVVLGLFGNTPKTPLVIPNKVYEALAVKKPVITADTPAIRELFDNKDLVLVRAADSGAIAEAILNLKSDPELMNQTAENGYQKFLKFALSQVLGKELRRLILTLLNEK